MISHLKKKIQAGAELGYDVTNPNGAQQTGFAPYLYTINNGMRWTPGDLDQITVELNCIFDMTQNCFNGQTSIIAKSPKYFFSFQVEGYLHRKHNLHVALKAHVHKIIFDEHNRAIGVRVAHKGHVRNVYASKEVRATKIKMWEMECS